MNFPVYYIAMAYIMQCVLRTSKYIINVGLFNYMSIWIYITKRFKYNEFNYYEIILFLFFDCQRVRKRVISISLPYIFIFFFKSLLKGMKGMCIYIYLTTGKKWTEKGNLGQSLNICNVILHIQILQNPCTT